jgi:DNA primase
MLSKFDIQKLQDLPIESVADALGLEVRRHKCLCPFHDDSHPSLTFSASRNRYRCYVCDARGGTIDLVMNTQHWTFYDSCKWLADKFDVYINEFSNSQILDIKKLETRNLKRETKKAVEQPLDLHYLEGLVAHPYLSPEAEEFLISQRHIDPRVVKWLGLSSISSPVPMSGNPNATWFNAPSILIPYRDVEGHLLSVQARYLGKEKDIPRFQFPKGSRCSIYNLPTLKLLTSGEPLFVTEGCSDCWSMLSAGHKAIAIPSATALKESDLKVLENHVVHIYPDQDRAGEALYDRLVHASLKYSFTLVRHQLPPDCKDFSDLYLKSLILDN